VGAGNSGVEIALELARTGKQVWLAGRDVGRIPANSPLGKLFDGQLVWWIMTHLLTVDTPVGRKIHAESANHGTPLGRVMREDIAKAGVVPTPRVAGVNSGKPQLIDGRILSPEGIIWATGFKPEYDWIRMPIFDPHGNPRHSRGIVEEVEGLYFLGLQFQTGESSSLLGGVGKDAAYIAARISQRKN
jgi:putative flavoprotein involved in K+ transport